MLTVKPGVQPPLIYLLAAIANVSEIVGLQLRITSGLDSQHSQWSGHYQLRAVDVGSKEFSAEQKELILATLEKELEIRLPVDRVYAALKSPGTEHEHFHVQFK